MKQTNLFGRIAATIVTMAVIAVFSPSIASATVQWLLGETYFQTGIDPYGQQNAYVSSTLSYYGNSDHSSPKVGERYWGSLFIAVTGQAASPSAYIAPEIALPPNTLFATDATNKVKCYFYPVGWYSPQAPTDVSNNTTYCNYNLVGAGLTGLGWSLGSRTLLTGEMLEIQFPMVSSAALRGNGITTDKMQGYVTTSSAYPLVGLPSAWVWVAASTPSITYPVPSTTLITDATAKSWADVYNHYSAGTVYFDLGATSAYGTSTSAGALTTANDVGNAYMNWTGLTPGTLYHWRSRFVVSGTGTVYLGADQTFTTTGTKPVTTYTLTLSSTAGGSATASPGGGTYALNTPVTLTPTPNDGYDFAYWTRDGVQVDITTYTIIMNTNYTVIAHFTPTVAATFTLTSGSTPTAGGTVTASPAGPTYTPGTSVSFTAAPSAGYLLGGWKVDGVDAGNANPLILTADAAHTVIAQFVLALSQNATAAKGSTDVPMLQFAVDAYSGVTDLFLTSIIIKSAGSGNDSADISLVKVYEDVNGNGIVDAGDLLVSSGTFTKDNGELTIDLNGSPYTLYANTGMHKFLVVYDFNTTLAGLLFAPFSLIFVGMLATGRTRSRILMALLSVALLSFLSCGGGGGGGGSDAGTRTYQVSISGGSVFDETYDPFSVQPLLNYPYNIVTHTVSVTK